MTIMESEKRKVLSSKNKKWKSKHNETEGPPCSSRGTAVSEDKCSGATVSEFIIKVCLLAYSLFLI